MYAAGCQTGCTIQFDNRLNEQWLFVQHGCQTGCQTVVKPVWQPVWQPAVSCKLGIRVMIIVCYLHTCCTQQPKRSCAQLNVAKTSHVLPVLCKISLKLFLKSDWLNHRLMGHSQVKYGSQVLTNDTRDHQYFVDLPDPLTHCQLR